MVWYCLDPDPDPSSQNKPDPDQTSKDKFGSGFNISGQTGYWSGSMIFSISGAEAGSRQNNRIWNPGHNDPLQTEGPTYGRRELRALKMKNFICCYGRAEGWFLAAELHLTLPPHLKSLPPHPIYLGPQNYRKMYMKLIHLWHFNANVYLVNPYFLTAQGKMRKLVRR